MKTFETQTCSRCGGSGHFSFNLKDGTKCYGCNGSGVKYTKRGLAAKEYFQNLMMVPVEQVKEGDFIQFFKTDKYLKEVGIKAVGKESELAKSYCVAQCKDKDRDIVYLQAKNNGDILIEFPGMLIRIKQSDEEKKSKFQQALAYQETLTATGSVRKNKVK